MEFTRIKFHILPNHDLRLEHFNVPANRPNPIPVIFKKMMRNRVGVGSRRWICALRSPAESQCDNHLEKKD